MSKRSADQQADKPPKKQRPARACGAPKKLEDEDGNTTVNALSKTKQKPTTPQQTELPVNSLNKTKQKPITPQHIEHLAKALKVGNPSSSAAAPPPGTSAGSRSTSSSSSSTSALAEESEGSSSSSSSSESDHARRIKKAKKSKAKIKALKNKQKLIQAQHQKDLAKAKASADSTSQDRFRRAKRRLKSAKTSKVKNKLGVSPVPAPPPRKDPSLEFIMQELRAMRSEALTTTAVLKSPRNMRELGKANALLAIIHASLDPSPFVQAIAKNLKEYDAHNDFAQAQTSLNAEAAALYPTIATTLVKLLTITHTTARPKRQPRQSNDLSMVLQALQGQQQPLFQQQQHQVQQPQPLQFQQFLQQQQVPGAPAQALIQAPVVQTQQQAIATGGLRIKHTGATNACKYCTMAQKAKPDQCNFLKANPSAGSTWIV